MELVSCQSKESFVLKLIECLIEHLADQRGTANENLLEFAQLAELLPDVVFVPSSSASSLLLLGDACDQLESPQFMALAEPVESLAKVKADSGRSGVEGYKKDELERLRLTDHRVFVYRIVGHSYSGHSNRASMNGCEGDSRSVSNGVHKCQHASSRGKSHVKAFGLHEDALTHGSFDRVQ